MTFDKSCLKRMKLSALVVRFNILFLQNLSINIIGRFTEKGTITYFFICPLSGGGGGGGGGKGP